MIHLNEHPAVSGVLKGYDQLLNMVLDEAIEYLRGMQMHAPAVGDQCMAWHGRDISGMCRMARHGMVHDMG